MIDARRLRILRAVADHRTVTAAAAALYLTPSAVSQQLAPWSRRPATGWSSAGRAGPG
ncbi:regulatory helix-turn-helix protein, lysR family [Streptomyces sp. DpondAA-F4]|nr:regulatory helix-turn-helix protein, lysR family [Streptomyces sp. DpondAA-F4]